MKKIFLILICLIFSSGLALAEHGTKNEKKYGSTQPQKMKGKNKYKSGFYSCVNGKFKHKSGTKVKDPQNTILIIYNHGGGFGQPDQKEPDRKSRLLATCGLGGIKIGDKETIMWNNKEMGGGGEKWGGAAGPIDYAPKGTLIWQKCMMKAKLVLRTMEDYELKEEPMTPETSFYKCIMTNFNSMKRFEKTVELVKMFIDQGVPPKQIFIIGVSAGGWDAVRMSGLYGNGKLINAGIAVDPGGWYFNAWGTPGGIYWFYMKEVRDKYTKPLPLLFFGMNSTDIGATAATYDDMKWIKEKGGEMIKFPEISMDKNVLKKGKREDKEYFLDGVECKIRNRANRGIGSYFEAASGHAFFYSACFPHYNPQIIDFITKKMQ